ncbi:hypothetical protein Rhopal_000108-T1 [Rhodotorula paludigena]|uniref:Rab-GAP TBC domain-containing protein n=1 Tax=Rhodotorula paludigena TaxID=86838 RepID=A0AAV5GAQ1_9BASI|nr:hypothetical protein Rhopal_000108-T1 [Rhodotorula paludigena]
MAQLRAPLPLAHDHPLSPPLDAPTSPILPDLRDELLSQRTNTGALSQQLEETQASLREGREELRALEKLASEKGASEGEVERAKVRARTALREGEEQGAGQTEGAKKGEEWRIDLPVRGEDEAIAVPAKVEVDLDLDDLTEAISSNAFDLGLSSPRPSDLGDASSIRSHAVSLPIASTQSADDRSDTASIASTSAVANPALSTSLPPNALARKPVRARHASLSARFVGYIAGGSSSSASTHAPPSAHPTSSGPPASPASSSFPTSSVPDNSPVKRRPGRSGSIRSLSSVASGASADKKSYGEWLGWKGWGRPATPSIREAEGGAIADEGGNPQEAEGDSVPAAGARTEPEEAPLSGPSSAAADSAGAAVAFGTEDGEQPAASSGSADPSQSASSSRRTSLAAPSLLATPSAESNQTSLDSPYTAEPTSPDRGKALSPNRRHSTTSSPSGPPDSPTLSRSRSPQPPPTLFPSVQHAAATAVLSTPLTTSTISAPTVPSPNRLGASSSPASPARSPSSRSIPLVSESSEDASSLHAATNEDVNSSKVRRSSGAGPHTTFIPGVPLYSAPAEMAGTFATDSGYAATARDTLSRALGLTPGALSPSASAASTSSPLNEPDLTIFPRLPSLSLSRYAMTAQPTLSTPPTHVSLSASTSSIASGAGAAHPSPLVPHMATLSGSSASASKGPQTMELDTISGEAAPPSLALLKPSFQSAAAAGADGASAGADDADGPMIDRYGFIYDVHTGMELLKESRRRKGEKVQSGADGRRGERIKGDEEKEPPTVEAVLSSPQTELEVHPQLDALREAIGLTPTSETGNALSPPATPALDSPTPPARPAQLVRDLSSTKSTSRSSSPAGSTGPQSMRALLVQLRTMTDAVEKTQQDAWDAFIRRRQAKLTKLKHKQQHDLAAASGEDGGASSGATGKHERFERPKSSWALTTDDADADSLASGEDAWTSENLVGVAQMGTEKKGKKADWNDFKDLVRRGIPIVYRPKIWGECSSANEAREPGVYQELLAQPTSAAESQCLKQIDLDCHRTFPTNVFFAGNGPGVAKLRNVLVAYSRRNPKIGYCQGMNNLVATLLLTHPTEEDAFWVLVCIIENILPSDYYTSLLLVSRADQQVLQDLVARIMPKVAAHLEEHGVELSAITRVWDLFFIHGTIFVFRIAVAILKLHEADLLECDSAASLYALLGQLPAGLWNADRLLKVACEDLAPLVKDREVSTLRQKHVEALQEEMGLAEEGGEA